MSKYSLSMKLLLATGTSCLVTFTDIYEHKFNLQTMILMHTRSYRQLQLIALRKVLKKVLFVFLVRKLNIRPKFVLITENVSQSQMLE